mmetsp:Transcript_26283/g.73748  ORF Transcript_26283/g.73748 Transcript_26283/m.73748 type:complete len:281 (-) Transcript_26283:1753-2595(-)
MFPTDRPANQTVSKARHSVQHRRMHELYLQDCVRGNCVNGLPISAINCHQEQTRQTAKLGPLRRRSRSQDRSQAARHHRATLPSQEPGVYLNSLPNESASVNHFHGNHEVPCLLGDRLERLKVGLDGVAVAVKVLASIQKEHISNLQHNVTDLARDALALAHDRHHRGVHLAAEANLTDGVPQQLRVHSKLRPQQVSGSWCLRGPWKRRATGKETGPHSYGQAWDHRLPVDRLLPFRADRRANRRGAIARLRVLDFRVFGCGQRAWTGAIGKLHILLDGV